MASLDPKVQKPHIAAENRSSGSQYFVDGDGDQNVAAGRGVQHNIRHQINSEPIKHSSIEVCHAVSCSP